MKEFTRAISVLRKSDSRKIKIRPGEIRRLQWPTSEAKQINGQLGDYKAFFTVTQKDTAQHLSTLRGFKDRLISVRGETKL